MVADEKLDRARWFFEKGDYQRAKRDARSVYDKVNRNSKKELDEILNYSEPKKQGFGKKLRFAAAGIIVAAGIGFSSMNSSGLEIKISQPIIESKIEAVDSPIEPKIEYQKQIDQSVVNPSPTTIPPAQVPSQAQPIQAPKTIVPQSAPITQPHPKDSILTYRLAKVNFTPSIYDVLFQTSRNSEIAGLYQSPQDFNKIQGFDIDDLINTIRIFMPDRSSQFYKVPEQEADWLANEMKKTGQAPYIASQAALNDIKQRGQMDRLVGLLIENPVYTPGQAPKLVNAAPTNLYVTNLLSNASELVFTKQQVAGYAPITIVNPQGAFEFRIQNNKYNQILNQFIELSLR